MSLGRQQSVFSAFSRDECGAALVEYGVALGVVLAITVATLPLIGAETNSVFEALLAEFRSLTD